MGHDHKELLTGLLKAVSRSFYLTLRVLPSRVRPQIGLAYLLARTTDTIADTELVPPERRMRALAALRDRILGRSNPPLDFGELAAHQSSPAERVLLEKCETSLDLLASLLPDDLALVRSVLDTITSGQELDLSRFRTASAQKIMALVTEADLEDYTYRVAGCVGEFWTRICRNHLFPRAPLDDRWLLDNGVRFGKGLQMVNILRDLPRDLGQGRCYLPSEGLSRFGLNPAQLLDPAMEPRLRPLYDEYLARAEAHLNAGWAYTTALPRGQVRVRLACAWPVLIGLETIQILRRNNVLDPSRRLKVPRSRVRSILLRSVLLYPWPRAWHALGA